MVFITAGLSSRQISYACQEDQSGPGAGVGVEGLGLSSARPPSTKRRARSGGPARCKSASHNHHHHQQHHHQHHHQHLGGWWPEALPFGLKPFWLSSLTAQPPLPPSFLAGAGQQAAAGTTVAHATGAGDSGLGHWGPRPNADLWPWPQKAPSEKLKKAEGSQNFRPGSGAQPVSH